MRTIVEKSPRRVLNRNLQITLVHVSGPSIVGIVLSTPKKQFFRYALVRSSNCLSFTVRNTDIGR